MPAYIDEETGLQFYYYGDDGTPAGAGKECQKFPHILKEACDSGEPFNDPNFPATHASIGDLDLNHSNGSPLTIKWKRCADIAQALFGKSPAGSGASSDAESDSEAPRAPPVLPIFEGVVNQYDVQQGYVGDCWLIATLSDVATKPELVKILVPEDNKTIGFDTGVFHFRFWCRGKWVDVVVDDQLPCVMKGDQIDSTAFSKPTKDGGFWAPLLEKAYAKAVDGLGIPNRKYESLHRMYGQYALITGGFTPDAMEDFTGGLVETYFKEDLHGNSLKENIEKAVKKDSLIGFGSVNEVPEELQTPKNPKDPGPEGVSNEGIVEGHAYTILDIQNVSGNDGTVYTLVNCRNPWGDTTEWNGDFSNSDPGGLWKTVDSDLRPGSGDKIDNGQFWIPVENLKPYVRSLYTCEWGKKFLEDKSSKTPTGEIFIDFGNFTEENSGHLGFAEKLEGKAGYYVYLRPSDPDKGEVKNGLRYNCEVIVTMMYTEYTKCGANPDIPEYGFYVFWAKGENKPVGNFFQGQDDVLNTGEFQNGVREFNYRVNLPAGTLLIVPWIKVWDGKSAPYYLRIIADGEVHQVRESNES